MVARPSVQDPFFKNSVVFVFECNHEQTTGVIINKKSNITTHEILNNMKVTPPMGNEPVYAGGPVSKQSILILHTKEWNSTSTFRVAGKYGVSSDDLMLRKYANGDTPRGYKFCAGVSVWQNEQLAREMENNAWLLVDLNKNIIFDHNGLTQWDLAIERAAKNTMDQYI
jgi:putative transcriptional regulator